MADQPFTREDVAEAVERLADNYYLGECDLDRDDLDEIVHIVLTSMRARGRLLPESSTVDAGSTDG